MTKGNQQYYTNLRSEARWRTKDSESSETLVTNGVIYWVPRCRFVLSSFQIQCITFPEYREGMDHNINVMLFKNHVTMS